MHEYVYASSFFFSGGFGLSLITDGRLSLTWSFLSFKGGAVGCVTVSQVHGSWFGFPGFLLQTCHKVDWVSLM